MTTEKITLKCQQLFVILRFYICLWIGIIVIVLMGFFPLWIMKFPVKPRRAFILTPILEAANHDNAGRHFKWVQIDAGVLFMHLFIVSVTSASSVHSVKNKL
jgi:hypothetical protein